MLAPWPAKDGAVDKEALAHFEALQAVTRAIRNARAEYGVELGRKIPATVCVSNSTLRYVATTLHACGHLFCCSHHTRCSTGLMTFTCVSSLCTPHICVLKGALSLTRCSKHC